MALLFILPAFLSAQNTLEQKSVPPGLFSTSNQTFNTNTSVTTRTISTTSGNYAFTHWTINGIRMNDANGQALHKVQFNLTENTVAIAHYLNSTIDSDADGIPDWREIKTSGNLNQHASSDLDGDGFPLEHEVKLGLNPSIENNVTEGGISMRRSQKVFVNLGGARKLTVRSDPAGLVSSQTTYPEVNSTYNSSALNGLSNGYYFSHWEVNGVRQADSKGVGLSKTTHVMTIDKDIVAKYFKDDLDSDQDTIPDWYEWHEFGHLSYSGNSDPDGDGFSVADERRLGLSAVIDDNITEGGISIRRSAKMIVNLGGASKVTLKSSPPGLIPSRITFPERNSTFTSTSLNGLSNGYYFSHWEINGVRQADTKGIALGKVTEVLNEDKKIIAKYYDQNLDSDSDSIPDWYELHEFGHLNHFGSSDPDGDGFSIADERRFGLSGVIKDNINEGGHSMRRSSQYSYVRDANDTTDTDGDGLTDSQEIQLGTNTKKADTDGDGFSDYQEGVDGTNPLSASSFRNVAPSSVVAPADGLSVEENRTIGTFVGNFNANDANDPANSGTYTYTLVDTNGSNDNSKFSLETNGTLTTNQVFDYEPLAELNATDLSIRVRVSDSEGLFVENNFTVSIINLVEDFDSDGIEDHLDPDDDNDGFSDAVELAAGTDPRNLKSIPNLPPSTLDLNGSSVLESLAIGSLVGQFTATDPDANSTLSFSLVDGNGSAHNSKFSVDTNGTLRTAIILDFESNVTVYHVRARVADEFNATLEGNFTISLLNALPPFIRTIENITSTEQKITLFGETATVSHLPLLTYGFQLSQSSLLSNSTTWNGISLSDSNFSTEIPLSELQPDTKYFFRAFGRNAEGTVHGAIQSFQTPSLSSSAAPWWESVPEIAGGWRTSPWLGTFLAYPEGWIYHADLGWLYAHSGPDTHLWLWSSDKGWLWTDIGIYPFLYQNSASNWLYFLKKKDGVPYFYDYTTKSIK